MEYTGLDSAPKILTEEDVLRHCYGVEPAAAEVLEEAGAADAGGPPADLIDPAPADPVAPTDPAPADPVAPDAVIEAGSDAAPAATDLVEEPTSDSPVPGAEMSPVEKIMAENTKAQLVEWATQLGIDATGNKAALAERIAEKLAQG